LPDIWVPVKRAKTVVVKAQDLMGRPIEIEAEGHLARILQHEIDHLSGFTILDRTDKEERRRAVREYMARQNRD
jgi:peptide deformylase